MTNDVPSFLCPRCGTIFVGFPSQPGVCNRCGGAELVDIGKEGEYNVRKIRKLHHAPFRPDVFLKFDGD